MSAAITLIVDDPSCMEPALTGLLWFLSRLIYENCLCVIQTTKTIPKYHDSKVGIVLRIKNDMVHCSQLKWISNSQYLQLKCIVIFFPHGCKALYRVYSAI